MNKFLLSLSLLIAVASPAHAFLTTSAGSCSGCKVILQANDVKEEAAQFLIDGSIVTQNFGKLYSDAQAIITAELGPEAAAGLTIEDFALQILAQQ